MNDRELLELAAKAAGAEWLKGTYENGWWLDDGWWNPLTDDGDALRLAVKLSIDIFINQISVVAQYGEKWIREECSAKERAAATRRAIVRAAAEIGRTNENSN